jgi:hypothetical protein
MWALLIPLLAAASPIAPVGTRNAMVVAKPSATLPGLRSFLENASAYSPTLAPGPLGRELGSALSLDVFDVGAWAEAGLDPEGPATLASDGPGIVLVLPVKDAKKVMARAKIGLGASGTVAPAKLKGGELLEAHIPGRQGPELASAVGLRGKWVALLIRGSDTRFLLSALEAHPAPGLDHAKGLTGGVLVLSISGDGLASVVALSPTSTQLGIDGRLNAPGGVVALPARDAYAEFHPATMFWAHAATEGWALSQAKASLAAWTHFLVVQVCRECSEKPTEQLAATLSGPTAMLVTRLAPEQSHSSNDIDRYYLLPEADAAQVKDPVAAHRAIEALRTELQEHHAAAESVALPGGEHYQLRLGKGRVLLFGLVGESLYLANATDARDALLAAIPAAPAHGKQAAALHLDGLAAGQAISKLSIFDAAASNDLAGLFAVAVEAAPLLKALGSIDLAAEPEGKSARVTGQLNLPARTGPTPGP